MIVQAVKADDRELEGSILLSSAIQRVKRYEAQDEAVARLVPLLDVKENRERLRARFCVLELHTRSPDAIHALIEIYRNPLVPWWNRIESAGLLTFLAPEEAQECGAAAAARQYFDRRTDLMSGEDRRRLAEEVLRIENANLRSRALKTE